MTKDEFVVQSEGEINSSDAVEAGGLASQLSEDSALALLKRPELQIEILVGLAKNSIFLKNRKVKLALIAHPKAPRHVALPLLRHLFTFDLMRVALMPTVAADIKVAAEESLIHRLEKLSLGEKLSLARRASGKVAAALLRDSEPRVVDTALQNGRLIESGVIRELSRPDATPYLVTVIRADPKWSVRTEIALALQKATDKSVRPTLSHAATSESVPELLLPGSE